MSIKPSGSWYWYFDKKYDRMMLDLGDGTVFRSKFTAEQLLPDQLKQQAFLEKDHAFYTRIHRAAQSVGLPPHFSSELALNAIIATRFLKPQITKSWYFLPKFSTLSPEVGDLVNATLSGGESQEALFMVVDTNNHASLCLLLESEVIISGKPLGFSEALKIMNDRLTPYSIR